MIVLDENNKIIDIDLNLVETKIADDIIKNGLPFCELFSALFWMNNFSCREQFIIKIASHRYHIYDWSISKKLASLLNEGSWIEFGDKKISKAYIEIITVSADDYSTYKLAYSFNEGAIVPSPRRGLSPFCVDFTKYYYINDVKITLFAFKDDLLINIAEQNIDKCSSSVAVPLSGCFSSKKDLYESIELNLPLISRNELHGMVNMYKYPTKGFFCSTCDVFIRDEIFKKRECEKCSSIVIDIISS